MARLSRSTSKQYVKACTSEEEAILTVSKRSEEQGEACHYEKIAEGRYIVYRTRDRKVMKALNYFRPDLTKFFTQEELDNNYLKFLATNGD